VPFTVASTCWRWCFHRESDHSERTPLTDARESPPSTCLSCHTIGKCAFLGCSSLATIVLPTALTSLGTFAFSGCTDIAKITIPASLTSVGDYAFDGSKQLHTLLVHASSLPIPTPTPTLTHPTTSDAACSPSPPLIWSTLSTVHIPSLARVHAPDHIIAQLGGAFAECTTVATLPPAARVAPHATTWAAGELWLWWYPPQRGGGPTAYFNPATRNHTCTTDARLDGPVGL
jgi:hypothetical protein